MRIAPMCILLSVALALACGTESRTLPFELQAHSFASANWSEPVNLGPVVNSCSRDINGTLSSDELSLYFTSNRPGTLGSNDLWVSRRASADGLWETPVNLGPVINSASDDGGASLSNDGHLLFFNSNRPGGQGGADIYVSRRRDPNDDFGWEPPVNLGAQVNTSGGERGPDFFAGAGNGGAEGGPATLYLNGGNLALQQADLYAVPMTPNGEPLGPAELLADLSAPGANDAGQSVRGDGREILFWSNRPGTSGFADIWVSTRRSVHDAWSTPENLGAPVNTAFAEERPNLSRDGRTLLFDSDRPGVCGGDQDIWMSTRTPSGH